MSYINQYEFNLNMIILKLTLKNTLHPLTDQTTFTLNT